MIRVARSSNSITWTASRSASGVSFGICGGAGGPNETPLLVADIVKSRAARHPLDRSSCGVGVMSQGSPGTLIAQCSHVPTLGAQGGGMFYHHDGKAGSIPSSIKVLWEQWEPWNRLAINLNLYL